MVTAADTPTVTRDKKSGMLDDDMPTSAQHTRRRFSTLRFVADNLLYLLFLFGLALLYIRNAHYSEELMRQIEKTKHAVREKRWEYMTAKAELMSASKQTQVAKAASTLGLKELSEPPRKIKIKKQ